MIGAIAAHSLRSFDLPCHYVIRHDRFNMADAGHIINTGRSKRMKSLLLINNILES